MKKSFVIFQLLALAACASAGVKIDQSKLTQLQKGKTTYEDVVAMFGKPTQAMIKDDGSKMISYAYYSIQTRPETFIPYAGAFVGGSDSENTVVMINFDKKDILQSYTSSQGSTGAGMGFNSISQPRNAQPTEVK